MSATKTQTKKRITTRTARGTAGDPSKVRHRTAPAAQARTGSARTAPAAPARSVPPRTARVGVRRPGISRPVNAKPVDPKPARTTPAGPSRLPFVLLVVGLLGIGLVGLLLLNIALTQDSMRLTELKRDTIGLQQQAQEVRNEISRLESPGELARQARAENMVDTDNPGFIAGDTGEVLGKPRVATAPRQPGVPEERPADRVPRADEAPDSGASDSGASQRRRGSDR